MRTFTIQIAGYLTSYNALRRAEVKSHNAKTFKAFLDRKARKKGKR